MLAGRDSAADGVDRGAELALQLPDGHLGEWLALVGSRHHALEAMPDLPEPIAEAERQHDLNAVGPKDDPGPSWAEASWMESTTASFLNPPPLPINGQHALSVSAPQNEDVAGWQNRRHSALESPLPPERNRASDGRKRTSH